MWWSFWDYRDVEWNYARFLVIVMEPLLIFLTTSISIPRDFDRDVIDLSDYFHEIRRWFFLSLIILNCFLVLDGPIVFHSESMWISYRLMQTFVMAALLLGLLDRRSWAQYLSSWAVLSMLIWSSAARFLPAAFE